MRVAEALRLLRRGERMALEGERMLREAVAAGVVPEVVFHVADASAATKAADAAGGASPLGDPASTLERARSVGARLVGVTTLELSRLSDLPSARGVVALALPPEPRLPDLARGALAVLLDGVQDPTNVGAILRSAEAFGTAGVVLTAGCASPFGSRALRASAGSALRLRVAHGSPPADALAWVEAGGAQLAGAVAHGGGPPVGLPFDAERPLVLAIGSEGRGLGEEVDRALDARISIPLAPSVESLNAAVAAGILLYVLSERRR